MNKSAQAPKNIILMSALLLLLCFPERIAAADSFAEAARALASKILANVGLLENAGFTFQSLASLEAQEIAAARQAIENELRTQGMRFSADSQAAVGIHVTLSENLQQLLWIAEIRRDQNSDIVMTAQTRPPEIFAKNNAQRVAIQVKSIFEQNDPILDLKLMDEELLVLDPRRLALYHRRNDRWELERSASLKSPQPLPRDARGRLSDSGDAVQVHLSGMVCTGTIKPALNLECSHDDAPWPLPPGDINLATGRNFFVPNELPAFFSASTVKDEGTDLWIIAGVDGRTRLFDKALNQVGALEGWGSDIAGVDSGCGTGRQILAALPTDPLERGAIQAFEILHRKAVAASSSVEFPGPITALWPVSNQNAAIAVSRDIKTGRYAAFYLSISCSR